MRLSEIYLLSEAGIYPTYIPNDKLNIQFVYVDLDQIIGDDEHDFMRLAVQPGTRLADSHYLSQIADAAHKKGYKVLAKTDDILTRAKVDRSILVKFLSPIRVTPINLDIGGYIQTPRAEHTIFVTSNTEDIKDLTGSGLLAVPFVKGKVGYTLDGINNPGRLSVMADLDPKNMGMYPLRYQERGIRTPGDDPRLFHVGAGKAYQIEIESNRMLNDLYTRQMHGTPLLLQIPDMKTGGITNIKVPVFSPFAAEDDLHQTLIEIMKKTADTAPAASRVKLADMCGGLFSDFVSRYMAQKSLGRLYSVHVPQSSSSFATEIINGMQASNNPPTNVYKYDKNKNPNSIIINEAGVIQTADTYIIDILRGELKAQGNPRRKYQRQYQIEENPKTIDQYCTDKASEGKDQSNIKIIWRNTYENTEADNNKKDLNRRLVQDLITNPRGRLATYSTSYDLIKDAVRAGWQKQAVKWASQKITTKQLDPLLRRGNLLNTFLPAPNSPPIDDKELAVIIDDIATFGMTARNIAAKIIEINPAVKDIISLTAFNFGS